MSKNTVITDKNICYFAKHSYDCEYWAAPINNDRRFSIIDIDNDGFEIIKNPNVIVRKYFPVTYKLKSWVGSNEGIIVLKKSEFRELFDLMDTFEGNNFRHAESLITSLGELDYDKNGILDSDDAGFKFLNIWRDVNQDMICQPEEVVSFSDLGIHSIELQKVQCLDNNQNTCSSIHTDQLLCNTTKGYWPLFGVTLFEMV